MFGWDTVEDKNPQISNLAKKITRRDFMRLLLFDSYAFLHYILAVLCRRSPEVRKARNGKECAALDRVQTNDNRVDSKVKVVNDEDIISITVPNQIFLVFGDNVLIQVNIVALVYDLPLFSQDNVEWYPSKAQ